MNWFFETRAIGRPSACSFDFCKSSFYTAIPPNVMPGPVIVTSLPVIVAVFYTVIYNFCFHETFPLRKYSTSTDTFFLLFQFHSIYIVIVLHKYFTSSQFPRSTALFEQQRVTQTDKPEYDKKKTEQTTNRTTPWLSCERNNSLLRFVVSRLK